MTDSRAVRPDDPRMVLDTPGGVRDLSPSLSAAWSDLVLSWFDQMITRTAGPR
ncbi:hypothetical protein [Actinoplanes sp. OR16]|uniref:hypothetical protein n=1 Tax=Actinoplanes sp. OR16 TaxID=946334 RepID=UPI00135F1AC7|nr:hypothetical protein [Actinoplanes sp. OR16]